MLGNSRLMSKSAQQSVIFFVYINIMFHHKHDQRIYCFKQFHKENTYNFLTKSNDNFKVGVLG